MVAENDRIPSVDERGGVGRSILAVLAGIVTTVVLHVGGDVALQSAGIMPHNDEPVSNQLLALATAYRTVFSIVAGYVTARLAPRRPLQHAVVLGVVGLVLTSAGVIAAIAQQNFDQLWYPIALAVTALPSAWLGGKMFVWQRGAN